jgi:hypothetical protein
MIEIGFIEGATLILSLSALLVSIRANRHARESESKNIQNRKNKAELKALHYIEKLLELTSRLNVICPADLTQDKIIKDIPTQIEIQKILKECENTIIAFYPDLSDCLNRISFRISRLLDINDFNSDNLLDEIYLVRAYRDIYGDFLSLAAKRKIYRWLKSSLDKDLDKVTDTYFEPLALRSLDFGKYSMAHGYEATRLEIHKGVVSKFDKLKI